MAFRINPTPTFAIEVTVTVANDKGGFDKNTFIAKFARASIDEQRALRLLDNDELVRKQIRGWELKDKDSGQDVPFNDETLAAILSISPTPSAAALAFWEGCNGARLKN